MIVWLLACAGAPGDKGGPPEDTAAVVDTSSAEDTELEADTGLEASFVFSSLVFGRERADGTAWGFDLDEDVSVADGATGCGQLDHTDPEGLAGIDNALSWIIPNVDDQVEEPTLRDRLDFLEQLMAGSIVTGDLLVLVSVQADADATCADLTLSRATGTPLVDTSGLVLDGQTFATDPDDTPITVSCAALADGTVRAGPFDLRLNLPILDGLPNQMSVHLKDAWIRLDLSEDGTVGWGYLDGAVSLTETEGLLADYVISTDGIEETVDDATSEAVHTHADLSLTGDGSCDGASVVFEFDAVQAFVAE